MSLVIAAGLASGCDAPDQRLPDAAAARKVVVSYLAAVEARDAYRVKSLVTPGNEASREVEARLRLYGGRRAASAKVEYVADFGGQVMRVSITDPAASGRAAKEELQLVADEGEWHVAFGQAPGARPGASTDPLR